MAQCHSPWTAFHVAFLLCAVSVSPLKLGSPQGQLPRLIFSVPTMANIKSVIEKALSLA